jgi:hypothetical protein
MKYGVYLRWWLLPCQQWSQRYDNRGNNKEVHMNKQNTNTAASDAMMADQLDSMRAQAVDEGSTVHGVMHGKLADAQISGLQVEFDPDEAEQAGAFVEDALSEQDALASSQDMGLQWTS